MGWAQWWPARTAMPSSLSALPDLFRAVAVEDEGQHAGLVVGRADQARPGTVTALGGVHQQVMLVAGDVLDADPLHVVDRRAQAHGVGDVAGAGLEAGRGAVVEGALEGDVGNHVAATLPGRHVFENVALAVHHADAGGARRPCGRRRRRNRRRCPAH
jgi:hypothetical protein